MNQILEVNFKKNNKNNNKNIFKILFTFSLLLLLILIVLIVFNINNLINNQKLSDKLLENYNISNLYSYTNLTTNLNNNTDSDISDWKVKIDTNDMTISGLWNVTREDYDNYTIIMTRIQDWSATVPKNYTFIVSQPDAPYTRADVWQPPLPYAAGSPSENGHYRNTFLPALLSQPQGVL